MSRLQFTTWAGHIVASKGWKPGVAPPFQRSTANPNYCAHFLSSLALSTKPAIVAHFSSLAGPHAIFRTHRDLNVDVAFLLAVSSDVVGLSPSFPSLLILAAALAPPPLLLPPEFSPRSLCLGYRNFTLWKKGVKFHEISMKLQYETSESFKN